MVAEAARTIFHQRRRGDPPWLHYKPQPLSALPVPPRIKRRPAYKDRIVGRVNVPVETDSPLSTPKPSQSYLWRVKEAKDFSN